MKNFIYIILVTFLALPMLSTAQNGRLKYADKMYNQQAYYYASEAYEDVLERKTDSIDIASKIATSYDKIGNTEKAIAWYKYLQQNDKIEKDQLLRLALLERQTENYTGSEELLASYQSQYGMDNIAADLFAKSSIDELKRDKNQFNLKLQDVNTASSEIGTSFINKNEVLIASSKRRSKATKRMQAWTGTFFYDIYRASINEQGDIGKLNLMKSEAKTKFNDGPAVFNEKTGYVYFTRNNFFGGKKGMDNNNTILLKIYKGKIENNKFVDVEEVNINGDNFSTAHPSVSADGKKLFFSSNRPGGFGGMDIYYVDLNDQGNTSGTPINLGSKVNTSQNEVFPHYDASENIVFFSSEGHFGLGGLDVYVAKLNKEYIANSVENLGAPINSPYDDFSFVNNASQTKGYFSSNRPGGQGDDDVYGFRQNFPIRNSAILNGIVKDLLTNENVPGSTVYLLSKNNEIIDSSKANENGNFEFMLSSIDDDFKLLASKDGYIDNEKAIPFNPKVVEYEEEVAIMPELNYFFSGTIKNKKTGELLEDVSITIVDNNGNTEFGKLTTTGDGQFKSEILPYEYKDNVSYAFRLEKKGFITNTFSISESLALEENIDVSKRLNIDLTEVEVGKTDLKDVIEINPIYFDLNKFNIRPDAAIELDKVVKIMQDNPGMVIELGSHTDSRGSASLNRSLSDKRAKASANYIISKGIARNRISGRGYGKSRLKISDAEIQKASTEAEKEALHEQNRRTEFIVTKMN